MDRDKELYAAAVLLDGYLKMNRETLKSIEQESLYIGIREVVNNISPAYKEEKSEVIKVFISTPEDWKRFQSSFENYD